MHTNINNRVLVLKLLICGLVSFSGAMAHADQVKPSPLSEKVEKLRKPAEQGDAYSQYLLGLCYYRGNGISQDFALAADWAHKAAEQGNTQAQVLIAECLYEGHGVDKNFKEAVKWYRKAAQTGDSSAEYMLGVCYENGNGVPRDLTESVRWYQIAAVRAHERRAMHSQDAMQMAWVFSRTM